MSSLQPDVFCLQEIRVREDQRTFPVKGYHSIINSADMSQYYGTAMYFKNGIHPLSVTFDQYESEFGYEGRIIAAEFPCYYLVNSYWPFSMRSADNKWLKHRLAWNKWLLAFTHLLQQKKPIIICGDINIVHEPVDAFDGKAFKRAGCFFPEEHEAFDRLLAEEKLIDTYRHLHPQEECLGRNGRYTTWSNSPDGVNRRNNEGFRIDYFLVSKTLMSSVSSSVIHDGLEGSDHCPISKHSNIAKYERYEKISYHPDTITRPDQCNGTADRRKGCL